VTSLPGTYNPPDTASEMAALTSVMRTVTNYGRPGIPGGETIRDPTFRPSSRNALGNIKTATDLARDVRQIRDLRREAIQGMEGDIRNTMAPLRWPRTELSLYLSVGRITTIARKTLEYYCALLAHLTSMVAEGGWGHADLDRQHFASELLKLRTAPHTTRAFFCLRVYIFLREADYVNFVNPKLAAARYVAMSSALAALRANQAMSGPEGCNKCGGFPGHAPGGGRICPLKHLTNALAQQLGQEIKQSKMTLAEVLAAHPP
jgi:hypothetical protein